MIENYEKNLENWLNQLKWKENPFTLKIDPSLFVGYEDQLKKLISHIREGHKVALVTGSTGSGKTTLLKLMETDLDRDYDVLYISKPPRKEDLKDIFLSKYKIPFLQRLFGVKVGLHDLHVHLNKKLGQKKLLMLLDETHEADIEVLKWLRTISDQVDNMQIVLAGLSTVEDMLRNNLETLRSRIMTHIELINLKREDSRELISKRIKSVGGEDTAPFTEKCVNEIYGLTGGFPREILKICNKLVQKAIEENKLEIDSVNLYLKSESSTEEQEKEEPKESVEIMLKKDFMNDLSYKQRKIIHLLDENKELFPSDIAEKLGFDKYKSKQHAVRSVNNILKRLSKMGYVDRKPMGKGFVYFLNIKTKNLLIKS
ncbi:MAG: AAA family ATPase [Candidatus Aenigmarchaeota archaeon]|nr:AAA family ATPase [Candidatus Aenigmarchaeota archaeon]